MLHVNPFSIHDFLGFLLLAGPALIFYLSYWRLGRARMDLLLANMLAIGAFACLMMFSVDNVVPQGVSSTDVPGASPRCLWLVRLQYAASFLYLPASIHFTHRFTHTRNVLSRHTPATYGLFLLLTPLVLLPAFLQPRLEPLAPTSSWMTAVPWYPRAGPLVAAQLAVWLATQVYTQALFHLHIRRTRGIAPEASRRANMIRLAMLVQGAGVAVDVAAAAAGYAGVALFPVTSTLAFLAIAASILGDRIESDRRQQQVARELTLASRIQSGLLPKPATGVCGFELSGWNQQAEQVGGDLYDFLCMPDGRWLILLADASGHGMGPALQVAQTRAALRAAAMQAPQDPAQVLQVANSLLSQDMQDGSFVTCFVGFLDPLRRSMQYASAGQGPILFYERRRGAFVTCDATAPPLGVLPDSEFAPEVAQRPLRPGDFMVVLSDGILEAFDARGQQFGIDRVVNTLRDHLAGNPAGILDALREALALFTGKQQHADDLTAVFLRHRTAANLALA